MLFRQLKESPVKGCMFWLFELTSFAANLVTILGGFRDLIGAPSTGSPPVHWHENSIISGFILFYGLTGLSTFIWSLVADKVVGPLRATVNAAVLYLIPTAFIMYSYADTFHKDRVVPYCLSITTVALFVILPILVGRILMEMFMAPNYYNHGD
ncbi:MAG: hypothetical protein ACOYYJ_17295 [Chloroflexota bacterium]